MSIESIPRDLRNLRACLLCSMVKSFDQFETDGCDNCERVLSMKLDRDKVSGVYAVSVSGSLPDHIVQELKEMGVHYRASLRDTTTT